MIDGIQEDDDRADEGPRVLRLLEDDGWYLVTTVGSHRQYKHPTKPGRVTLAGKLAKICRSAPSAAS